MSKHQIIYTSCRRGIDSGERDGQQIYSYDKAFAAGGVPGEINALFAYTVPELSSGTALGVDIEETNRLIRRMPKKFSHLCLSDGRHAVLLNSYLGWDYMGTDGRIGNTLSHVIIADDEDLDIYPCELYKSPSLRSRMSFEEVNSESAPPYLPEPGLEPGEAISLESVREFMLPQERREVFAHILHALLIAEDEKKRVLINDTPENIIMWIAALEYMLPLGLAKTIPFTTYEYNPATSASLVCGVYDEGTRYEMNTSAYSIYDFKREYFESYPADEEFAGFTDTVMLVSPNALKAFHSFLERGCCYDKINTDIYAAYKLFKIMCSGIDAVSDASDAAAAVAFLEKYGKQSEKERLAWLVTGHDKALAKCSEGLFAVYSDYAVRYFDTLDSERRQEFGRLLSDRFFSAFNSEEVDESSFLLLCDTLDGVSDKIGVPAAIGTDNIEELDSMLEYALQTESAWRINYLISRLAAFARKSADRAELLKQDREIGSRFYCIIKYVYESGMSSPFGFVEKISDSTADSPEALIGMTTELEGMLIDTEGGEADVKALWQHFCRTAAERFSDSITGISRTVLEYGRFDTVFGLYSAGLDKCTDAAACEDCFNAHYQGAVKADADYEQACREKILTVYKERLDACADNAEQIKRLTELVMTERVPLPFMKELTDAAIAAIDMSAVTREDKKLAVKAFNYRRELGETAVNKRQVLILALVWLDNAAKHADKDMDLAGASSVFIENSGNEKPDLTVLDSAASEGYIEQLIRTVFRICGSTRDMKDITRTFVMSPEQKDCYFRGLDRLYAENARITQKDELYIQFLVLILSEADRKTRLEIGRSLGRQRMEEMDTPVRMKADHAGQGAWEEMKAAAEGSGPIFKGLASAVSKMGLGKLFGGKKN